MSVQVESLLWLQFWPRARSLVEAAQVERGLPLEEFDLDTVEMQSLEFARRLLILGAEEEGTLLGYLAWMIHPQFGSRGVLFASQLSFYVRSQDRKRRFLVELREKSLQLLRRRGVRRVKWNFPEAFSEPGWLRREARPFERSWLMDLDEEEEN